MILDIIALIIMAFCIIRGIKKGFVKTIFGTFSFLIALILTIITLESAAAYISKTDLGKAIYENTDINIINSVVEVGEEGQLGGLIDLSDILESAEKTEAELSEKAADVIIKALTSIGLFILYLLALKIFMHVLNFVVKLPVLSAFNKVGGLLSGMLNAYIAMVVFACIITALISTEYGAEISGQLKDSYITSFFYENNPLLKG